jgi:hypothetical protein
MFNLKGEVAVEVDLDILPVAQEDHHGAVVTEAVLIIIVALAHL